MTREKQNTRKRRKFVINKTRNYRRLSHALNGVELYVHSDKARRPPRGMRLSTIKNVT